MRALNIFSFAQHDNAARYADMVDPWSYDRVFGHFVRSLLQYLFSTSSPGSVCVARFALLLSFFISPGLAGRRRMDSYPKLTGTDGTNENRDFAFWWDLTFSIVHNTLTT
jgi:hypothetical protein